VRAFTRWHDLILDARNDIATIMTMECGKPLAESQAEITSG
jgi:acyl-CoA reductase-like NAD-dependent aldehyde dehydrogenase